MTDSAREPEQWKPIPDGPGYECSWDGNFRAKDRVTASGRRLEAQSIATTTTKDGYVLVKYRNAEGERVTRQAHRVMLWAFAGECPEGMESRHYDDKPGRNVWRPGTEEESRARGGNLFWGTPDQNREDRRRNAPPPPPVPIRECVVCSGPFQGNGRRCHPCVVDTGRQAARRMSRGETLAEAMKALDYPSAEGLHTLAVKYGGYGARKSWWSRSVKPKVVTLRKQVPGKRRSRAATKRATAGKGAPEGRKSVGALPRKPGHSGTFTSQNVAERNRAAKPHIPLPAEVTHRNRPPRGGRSR